MEKLEADSMVPLYQQLSTIIVSQIEKGEFKSGEQIPSEEQLLRLYGVSRVTVRKAIKQLVDENILVKKQGKGTFVSRPISVETMTAGGSFTESALKMKKKPSTKVISIHKTAATKHIASYLGVEETTEILVIERVRLLDKEPAILEFDYFHMNQDDMEQLDFEKESLIEALQKKGYLLGSFENIIEIALADEEMATYLLVDVEEPLIKINQTVLDSNNQVLYFNEQYVKSEIYKVGIRSYTN